MVSKKKKQRTVLDDLTPNHRSLLKKRATAKKKLTAFLVKWKRQLWLGQWTVDTVWEWDGLDDLPASATCSCDWRYMIATITFDLIKCSDLDDDRLENLVVHELFHMVVNEMREEGIDHEERVVSHLTSIITNLK